MLSVCLSYVYAKCLVSNVYAKCLSYVHAKCLLSYVYVRFATLQKWDVYLNISKTFSKYI